MTDRQQRDQDWVVAEPDGEVLTWERAGIAVLMDIRRELRRLNGLLACDQFLAVPGDLREIVRNTRRPKRKRGRR